MSTYTRPQSRTWWQKRTTPQRPAKTASEYLRRHDLDRMGVNERPTLWQRFLRLLIVCFTHRTP